MKRVHFYVLLVVILSLAGVNASAYDIAVKNADGITIYYNYINDGKELEVTCGNNGIKGNVVIPEEVTYMNRTRKVTSIGKNAFKFTELTSVIIPNSVTSIGDQAFSGCTSLTDIYIPNSVTSIGISAFSSCSGLTSVSIPNSVTSIGTFAFSGCSNLSSVTIGNGVTSIGKNAFESTGLTSVIIPNSVTSIGDGAFWCCLSLTSVSIPNSVTSIGDQAFSGCRSLTDIYIPNSVTSIGISAFDNCHALTSVTIPNSVTFIGERGFYNADIPTVISQIETPFEISSSVFSINTLNNATLYVPKGTINLYKVIKGWKEFMFIEEGTGPNDGGGETPETKKCAKPTIGYQNGKLTFACNTEGATCLYSITDEDIKTGSGNEVQLAVKYNISVYATMTGYENSETVTATLCWVDATPSMNGIANGIATIPANAVLIQSNGGTINVQGADDGTQINVYGTDGSQAGSTVSQNGTATINTTLKPGSVAILKIGQKSVKTVIK